MALSIEAKAGRYLSTDSKSIRNLSLNSSISNVGSAAFARRKAGPASGGAACRRGQKLRADAVGKGLDIPDTSSAAAIISGLLLCAFSASKPRTVCDDGLLVIMDTVLANTLATPLNTGLETKFSNPGDLGSGVFRMV